MKEIVLFIIILFYNVYIMESQIVLAIPDTTIPRGEIYQIPIRGDINHDNIDNIRIILTFNALSLDIKKIIGADTYAIKCDDISNNIVYNDLYNAELIIDCSDVQNISEGIICMLSIEGLVAPDSISTIIPKNIKINGDEIIAPTLISGEITVPGESIIQKYIEGIGNNYPNPFIYETNIALTIDKPTNVQFYLYSNDGRLLLSNKIQTPMLKLSVYKNNIEIAINDLNSKLEQGYYLLQLTPDVMQFASGSYYFVMITENGTYYKNLMYLK